MKGRDIRRAIEHIGAIKKLLISDYEDDISDLACYLDDERGFGFKEIESMPEHADGRIIRYIANHLLALSDIFPEYAERTSGIAREIGRENMIMEDTAGDIEDLTGGITCRINDIDVPIPDEAKKETDADKGEPGGIKITYEVFAGDRLARTIKDVAEELGYAYDDEQLKDVYIRIVEDILERYLSLEYIDTDTISDLVIDCFTREEGV